MLLNRVRAVGAGVLLLLCGGAVAAAGPALKVNGSTTVNLVAAEAAEVLRAERGMAITVDTQGGSSGGISGVGDGSVDVGMSSKPLSEEDRRKYPKVRFVETHVGQDAVALVVSADVRDGGVKSLSREDVRALYESRVMSWKQLGGPDRRVVFFNKEPGRGTWEVFAHWLYGSAKAAPEVRHPEVGGNEETRNKVSSTRGAISQLSSSWAEGSTRIHALALRNADGTLVRPDAASIASGAYPMSRPLFFVTNGPPSGAAKTFIDFVLSPRGQEIVRRHGYLARADLAPREGKR